MQEAIIKKRKIELSKDVFEEGMTEIKKHLEKMNGVLGVKVDNKAGFIKLRYNLREVNFEKIEKKIIELGFHLSEKWTDKFSRGFVKFKEQNELDQLSSPVSPCCSEKKI